MPKKSGRKRHSITSRSVKVRSRRPLVSSRKLAHHYARGKRPVLIHHVHTGKRIPHHHTSFALLGFILLLVGILLASVTFNVNAADLVITGKVAAPAPTIPAVITSPADQDRFTAVPITVSGTCQANQVIRLYRNGDFSGSVFCTGSGTFSIETDLSSGANTLIASTFNVTDDEGPASSPIMVYYDPPATPTPNPSSPSSPPSGSGSLIISVDPKLNIYQLGQPLEWQLKVSNGTPSYTMKIDWGDGTTNTYTLREDGSADLRHVYDSLGDNNGQYVVKIRVTDKNGATVFLQVGILVRGPNIALATGGGATSGSFSDRPLYTRLQIAWFGWLFLLLALLSFWLGARWMHDRDERRGRLQPRHQ